VINAELQRYLPFLATTKVLITAVRHGVGRETAHEAIKEHSVAVALQMRETGRIDNDLLERLAADPRLGITRAELEAAITDPIELTGTAGQQVATLAAEIEKLAAAHPDAANYRPGPVL
jgi:adenylosuccinate lyase